MIVVIDNRSALCSPGDLSQQCDVINQLMVRSWLETIFDLLQVNGLYLLIYQTGGNWILPGLKH